MMQLRFQPVFVLAAIIAALLSGCGGGGEGASTQSAGSGGIQSLAWDPPQTFSDNSPMNPYQDLDYYELYISSAPSFTDNDAPVAQVAAVANVLNPDGISYTQTLTSEFSLGNLLPFTEQGAVYYISIRSVGVDGLKSDFSAPVTWNLT